MQPSGDMTRYIRNFKTIINSEYDDDFIKDQLKISEQVLDKLPVSSHIDTKSIALLRTDNDIINELETSFDKYTTKAKRDDTKNKPIQLLKKAITLLGNIDINIVIRLNDKDMNKFYERLYELETIINDIKGNI